MHARLMNMVPAVVFAVALAVVLGVYGCTDKSHTLESSRESIISAQQLLASAVAARLDGKYDDALRLLGEVKMRSAATPSHQLRGNYYDVVAQLAFETGNYDIAITANVLHLLVMDDERLRYQTNMRLAHALKKVGDTVKAIHWYRLPAFDIPPDHIADAKRNLAWLYISVGLYDSTLSNLEYAESVSRLALFQHDAQQAWTSMIKARAYASLGRKQDALQELDHGLRLFETTPAYKLGDPTVRVSICRGILNDSLRFINVGLKWNHLRTRLHRIISSSAVAVEQATTSRTTAADVRKRLLEALPLQDYDWVTPPMTIDQLPMLTAVASDRRDWQWVSSLQGVLLRSGSRLLHVEALRELHMPYRDVLVDGDLLRVVAYSDHVDTVNLQAVVWQNPDTSAWLKKQQYKFTVLPWQGPRATAVARGASPTDSLWFIFTNTIGRGTTASVPSEIRDLYTVDGRRWTDTVRHAIYFDDSTLFAATTYGVWRIHPRHGTMQQLILSPSGINTANVNTLNRMNDSIIVTHEFEAIHQHVITHRSKVPASSERVNWVDATSSRFVNDLRIDGGSPAQVSTSQISVRGLSIVDAQPLYYHHHNPIIHADSGLTVLLPQRLLTVSRQDTSTIITQIPAEILARDPGTQLQFADSSGMIGITNERGMVIGRLVEQRRAAGGTLIAYKSVSASAYQLGSDGARITLPEMERSIHLIVSRPGTYGSLAIPLLIHLPWNDSTISASTGLEVTINNVPAGQHRVVVRAEDQPVDVPIFISVEPTLAEATWFRVVSVATLLTLIVVGVQYLRFSRSRRVEQQQRVLLEERVSIGRDLHDAVGAGLVRINMLAKTIGNDPATVEIQRAVREANRNLRDVVWSVADVQTIDAALAVIAERVHTAGDEANIETVIDIPSDLPTWQVEPQVLRDVMLIVTEALTNAIKHSGASLLEYTVLLRSDGLEILFKDNGAGFDIQSPKSGLGTGIGVESMRARARRSGLNLTVSSSSTAGTTIHIVLPSTFNDSHRHR